MYKEVEGHPNYGVSYCGKIINLTTNEQLSPYDKEGYRVVELNGKHWRLHRLVAIAYKPNPDNLPVVNHLDEDKSNCHGDNLEWCTQAHNVEYSLAGTYSFISPDGIKVNVFNLSKFCRDNELTQPNMSVVINGRRKSHKGWSLAKEDVSQP